MNYYIRYIDLPCSINAMTVMDSDGFFNIYVNARLDYDSQQSAIKHEIAHIRQDDFYKSDAPITQIENIDRKCPATI